MKRIKITYINNTDVYEADEFQTCYPGWIYILKDKKVVAAIRATSGVCKVEVIDKG
jgi:hypothetical protein